MLKWQSTEIQSFEFSNRYANFEYSNEYANGDYHVFLSECRKLFGDPLVFFSVTEEL